MSASSSTGGSESAPVQLLVTDSVGSTPLPRLLTQLVGRERETEAVAARIRRDEGRLFTLTGPGGVGKTRLSLAIAQSLANDFPDGVAFVSLATVFDSALVVPTIARAVGVRESGGRTVAERLAESLSGSSALLVLDNFEQVTAAAPEIASLLAACPGLKALVSSRIPLRVAGEQEIPVSPLAVPHGLDSGQIDLTEAPAVSLFLQRAKAVRPDFVLNASNTSAVVEVCRRLDGLPLAIELAAARIKVLSPTALLARLSAGLEVLTGGPQDMPVRQQTIRATISWSYDLLPESEKTLFRRLAIFVGGCTLEAAEQIGADPDDTGGVLDRVAGLVDSSLLRRDEGFGDEARFTMLETVREFGLERLAEHGETTAIRGAHADWCQRVADIAWDAFVHRSEVDSDMHRVELEHDNVRAALAHLRDTGDTDQMLRLAAGMSWFWLIRGYVREGREWLAQALQQSDGKTSEARARAMLGAGSLAHYSGDEARAVAWLKQSLVDARALGNTWLTSQALTNLAVDEMDEGNFEQARPLFEEAMARALEMNDLATFAQAKAHRGLVGWALGEGDGAETLVHEALALQRRAGDTWGVCDSLAFLGLMASERGDRARALAYVEESLRGRIAMGAAQYLPWSIENVALVAALARFHIEATRLFAAGDNLRERIGSPGHDPERGVYRQACERLLNTLGEPVFAAAWAAGRALSSEEALAETWTVIAAMKPQAPAERKAVPAAGFGLTERELEVLGLVAAGRTNQEIGDQLFISVRTASKHIANIFEKLEVNTRTAAVTTALRAGLITNESSPGA